MTANRNDRDAYDLGHYYARKFTRGKRPSISRQQIEALLSATADIALHAYAINSTPLISTEAFVTQFVQGFYAATRDDA